MRHLFVSALFVICAFLLVLIPAHAAQSEASGSATRDAILVLDASGSMWARMNGRPQIVVAKDVILDLLGDMSSNYRLGLMAYGHRRKGDCSDIQMLVPVGGGRNEIRQAIKDISPKGKTPMTRAVINAAEKLRYTENKATVILVSDGKESCDMDPCAAAKRLEQLGVGLTVHAIGFGMKKGSEGLKQVQCFANATGGQFFAADNAEELTQALAQVSVAKSQPPEITLTVPERVKIDETFKVSWSAVVNAKDQIILVPAEAENKASEYALQVGQQTSGKLTAPAQMGLYQVRYVSSQSGQVLARAPIQVISEVEINAPKQVTVGSAFEVSWSKVINQYDDYTIVPAGAEERTHSNNNSNDVGHRHKGKLRAPAKPGLYEVRYVLYEGGATVASTPVEVVEAQVEITAPKQVTVGSAFEVSWSKVINQYDDYTIVPAGAEERTHSNNNSNDVGHRHKGKLRAPAKPGLYEVRYVLYEGGATVASTPVEVVAAEVDIVAPKKVRTGTVFEVSWSKPINQYDDYTIVPAGAEEGTIGNSNDVGHRHKGKLRAPDKPGLYEVRYVLYEGGVTVASTPVEVVPTNAPLSSGAQLKVPKQAAPGTTITVTWTGGSDSEDRRITLTRVDQSDFTWIEAQEVNGQKTVQFTLPDEPGRYEIRYLDVSNMKVLGRAIVQVR